jgi:hypothetical protein
MDAQVLLNGKFDLADSSHPARRRFCVGGVKQLPYVSGSVYYDGENFEGGRKFPPLAMEFGISVLVDASKRGAFRIDKSDERSHAAAVPGLFQPRLPVGCHEIDPAGFRTLSEQPQRFLLLRHAVRPRLSVG